MFFAALIAAPFIAGFVAGVFTSQRTVPWVLAGACVALGVAGAVAMGLDADQRGENVTFAIVAGIACAALVWAGYGLARLGRRSISHA